MTWRGHHEAASLFCDHSEMSNKKGGKELGERDI